MAVPLHIVPRLRSTPRRIALDGFTVSEGMHRLGSGLRCSTTASISDGGAFRIRDELRAGNDAASLPDASAIAGVEPRVDRVLRQLESLRDAAAALAQGT